MSGLATPEGFPKRSALMILAMRAACGCARAALALLVCLVATARPGRCASAATKGPAPIQGIVLAQGQLPPGFGDDTGSGEEEDDQEEAPGDTLSFPQGFTPPPATQTAPPSTGRSGAAADSTSADSTGRALMIPVTPALGDTLRHAPRDSTAAAAPPAIKPAPVAPPPRTGFFGIHPAAIALGLIVAHYFIVKAVTD